MFGHIEIVALVAPAFIEDLFELFLGIEIHPQAEGQPTLTRRWRIAIGINDEKRRSGRRATGAWSSTTAAAATGRAIN